MTWCETQVANFNAMLKLDAAREERVVSAVRRLEDFCESDEQLKIARCEDVFLHGSVATGTVIKPLKSDEFDVDVVYGFDLNRFPAGTTATQIMEWFKSRLQKSDFYAKNLIPRDRCVRIDYAGDFHVDVIPATSSIAKKQPSSLKHPIDRTLFGTGIFGQLT